MSGFFPENMKTVILFSSIALAVLVSAKQDNIPPRSVNVALKTSFLFDPKDLNDNKSFINNIRRFLDKLNKTLDPQTEEKQFRTETKSQGEEEGLEEFIEVMQSIGQSFLNRTARKNKETLDTNFVEVANVTKEQHTLLRQLLPNTWLNMTPEEMYIKMKVNLKAYVNKPLITTFARRLRSYYNTDDVKELNKIFKKFKRYIDNNKDTTKIIKNLLNTVFNKYDNLNESAKAAVMGDLKMLSDFLVAKNSMTGPEYSKNSPSHEIVDKDEIPDDITYNALRRSIDEKIWNAREKKEDNNKKDTNDFFVGNVELFVNPQNL